RSAGCPTQEISARAHHARPGEPGGHMARTLSRDRFIDQRWRPARHRRAGDRRHAPIRWPVPAFLRLVRGPVSHAFTQARGRHAGARAPLGPTRGIKHVSQAVAVRHHPGGSMRSSVITIALATAGVVLLVACGGSTSPYGGGGGGGGGGGCTPT